MTTKISESVHGSEPLNGVSEPDKKAAQKALNELSLRTLGRELPEFWKERPGQWVAYRGDTLLGFADERHELNQYCFRLGLAQGEFQVYCIDPIMFELILDSASIE